jgi:hypothetical protein
MNRIEIPFTEDQVASLNAYQTDGRLHPFTCKNGSCPVRTLQAAEWGWTCPGCTYTQSWAYDWMGNWEWKKMIDELAGVLGGGSVWRR